MAAPNVSPALAIMIFGAPAALQRAENRMEGDLDISSGSVQLVSGCLSASSMPAGKCGTVAASSHSAFHQMDSDVLKSIGDYHWNDKRHDVACRLAARPRAP